MDANATPFDLSNPMYCRAIKEELLKQEDNLLWLDKISYPFKIPTEENLSFDDTIYATLVSINNEWFIKHFTFDNTPIDRKILV